MNLVSRDRCVDQLRQNSETRNASPWWPCRRWSGFFVPRYPPPFSLFHFSPHLFPLFRGNRGKKTKSHLRLPPPGSELAVAVSLIANVANPLPFPPIPFFRTKVGEKWGGKKKQNKNEPFVCERGERKMKRNGWPVHTHTHTHTPKRVRVGATQKLLPRQVYLVLPGFFFFSTATNQCFAVWLWIARLPRLWPPSIARNETRSEHRPDFTYFSSSICVPVQDERERERERGPSGGHPKVSLTSRRSCTCNRWVSADNGANGLFPSTATKSPSLTREQGCHQLLPSFTEFVVRFDEFSWHQVGWTWDKLTLTSN